MDRFVLHSDFKPMGDQPQAIEALTKGVEEGKQFETLVGVNGSGKHNNWSISTDTGKNILNPGKDPIHNKVFLPYLPL